MGISFSYREENCDVTLPWQQNVWITAIGSLNNSDGDGNENDQKVISLDSKATTLHVHHAFLYIS